MKFLHTADWHLGRLFHQIHLTEDQAHVLDQLCSLVERERPDAILLAGDVFDRAVPPPEAVELLDRTLTRLLLDLRTPIVMIPGNHDSARRLGFGARLMRGAGLHLVADLAAAMEPVAFGEVDVFALPYAEPAEVRAFLADESVVDHQSATLAMVTRMRQRFRPGRRRVLVAHAFVTGARTSESERPLSVGGAGMVDAGVFADFDYVALGHLHAPQTIAAGCIYAGSPLKYSFSEVDHTKSVGLVEVPPTGPVQVTTCSLVPRRDVRRLEGALAVLRASPSEPSEDYLHITLTDDGALLNALARLREVHPNVLQIERRFLQTTLPATATRRQSSEVELFHAFCREVLGTEAGEAELAVFAEAWGGANSEGVT